MISSVVPRSLVDAVFREEPDYLSLAQIEPWEPLAKRLGVSEVARSRAGFMGAYRAAGGDPRKLPEWWRRRRWNFIKRHIKQALVNREPLVDERTEMPSRRHLALIFWAWSPMLDLKRPL